MKELAIIQEKLKAINTLSNNLQKIDNVKAKNDIAYLIHEIIEADYIDSNLSRQITAYSIMANKDLFVAI